MLASVGAGDENVRSFFARHIDGVLSEEFGK